MPTKGYTQLHPLPWKVQRLVLPCQVQKLYTLYSDTISVYHTMQGTAIRPWQFVPSMAWFYSGTVGCLRSCVQQKYWSTICTRISTLQGRVVCLWKEATHSALLTRPRAMHSTNKLPQIAIHFYPLFTPLHSTMHQHNKVPYIQEKRLVWDIGPFFHLILKFFCLLCPPMIYVARVDF